MGGLFLAGGLAFGIGVYGFTQFLNPIQAEFGWNRAVLGGLMSAFWLAAPFVILAAHAIERIGIRPVVFIGAAVEAIGLVLLTRLSSPFEFWLVRFLMGAGKCLVVTPLPIAVARWFPARTGFAFAVSLCGWHVGGFIMAPLAATLISAHGWRSAALALAALLMAGMALATALMRAPHYTGTEVAADTSRAPAPAARVSVPALAALGMVTLVFYAGYAAFLSQISPLLKDCGLGPAAISQAASVIAFSAMGGVLLCGLATQLGPPRLIVAVLLGVMGLLEAGTLALHKGVGTLAILAVIVPAGALIGGGDPILIEALRRCVPAKGFGRAYGWWYLVCLSSLAVIPVAIGASFDAMGSYRGAFTLMAGVSAATVIGWWLAARDASLR